MLISNLLIGRRKCRPAGRNNFRCSLHDKVPLNAHGVLSTKLLSCLAASLVFISPPCQVPINVNLLSDVYTLRLCLVHTKIGSLVEIGTM